MKKSFKKCFLSVSAVVVAAHNFLCCLLKEDVLDTVSFCCGGKKGNLMAGSALAKIEKKTAQEV